MCEFSHLIQYVFLWHVQVAKGRHKMPLGKKEGLVCISSTDGHR